MRRVEEDLPWSLFCPRNFRSLSGVYGKDFDDRYRDLEERGLAGKTIPARTLWELILEAQIETGGPFMLYKDAINGASCSFVKIRILNIIQQRVIIFNWEPSRPPTCARRSCSSHLPRKQLFAI